MICECGCTLVAVKFQSGAVYFYCAETVRKTITLGVLSASQVKS